MAPANEALIKKLEAGGNDYSHYTQLSDGKLACIARFAFTYAILYGLNDWGYDNRWCYHSLFDAQDALEEWAGHYDTQLEPSGWHRHPATGRRLREDGTMYVHF